MNLELMPTLKAMKTSLLGFALIMFQVLLSVAVAINAVSASRWVGSQLNAETGVDEDNLLHITVYGFSSQFVVGVDADNDLRYLRSHPKVANAIQSNAVPLSNSGWYTTLRTSTESDAIEINAARYMVDDQAIDTLQLELLYGRNFLPEEIVWRDGPNHARPPAMIITESLASKLYPDIPVEEVIGKFIYFDGDVGASVVGILRYLPQPGANNDNLHDSFMVSQKLAWARYNLIVRAQEGFRDSLLPELEQELIELNPNRIVSNIQTLEDTYRRSTNGNVAVVWIFSVTTVLLAITTMLSIVGVENFNVKRRIRQISIRRVLGATRWGIVRYFLVEIAIVLGIGLSLGLLVGIYFNGVLVTSAEFPKLDWIDATFPTIAFLVLGLTSVFITSLQTTRISPVPR